MTGAIAGHQAAHELSIKNESSPQSKRYEVFFSVGGAESDARTVRTEQRPTWKPGRTWQGTSFVWCTEHWKRAIDLRVEPTRIRCFPISKLKIRGAESCLENGEDSLRCMTRWQLDEVWTTARKFCLHQKLHKCTTSQTLFKLGTRLREHTGDKFFSMPQILRKSWRHSSICFHATHR